MRPSAARNRAVVATLPASLASTYMTLPRRRASRRGTLAPAIAAPLPSKVDLLFPNRPYRVPGQGTQTEVRARDLRAELEQRELDHLKAIGKAPVARPPPPLPPPEEDEEDEAGVGLIIDPEDADDRHVPTAAPAESDDESDDEDETEELMRELERIKKERATEAAKRQREAAETEAREADSAILQGNPLLDPTRLGAAVGGEATFSVKRRCAQSHHRCPTRALRHRTQPPARRVHPGGRAGASERSYRRAFSQLDRGPCLEKKTLAALALSHRPNLRAPPTPAVSCVAGGTTTWCSKIRRASPRRRRGASLMTPCGTTFIRSFCSATSSEHGTPAACGADGPIAGGSLWPAAVAEPACNVTAC